MLTMLNQEFNNFETTQLIPPFEGEINKKRRESLSSINHAALCILAELELSNGTAARGDMRSAIINETNYSADTIDRYTKQLKEDELLNVLGKRKNIVELLPEGCEVISQLKAIDPFLLREPGIVREKFRVGMIPFRILDYVAQAQDYEDDGGTQWVKESVESLALEINAGAGSVERIIAKLINDEMIVTGVSSLDNSISAIGVTPLGAKEYKETISRLRNKEGVNPDEDIEHIMLLVDQIKETDPILADDIGLSATDSTALARMNQRRFQAYKARVEGLHAQVVSKRPQQQFATAA